MPDDSAVRVRVYFSGRVQGVGFRYTTRELAAGYAVTGYVQNLPDGRVLLMAEGARDEVERFLAALRRRMSRYIGGEECDTLSATGEFADFSVRR